MWVVMLKIINYRTDPFLCPFKAACDGHDNCYSDCAKSKGDCDSAFGSALQSACNSCASSMAPGKEREKFEKNCKKWAERYAWHVKHGIGGGIAGGAYKNRQQANCDCVCP